jgi:hypothetical protein
MGIFDTEEGKSNLLWAPSLVLEVCRRWAIFPFLGRSVAGFGCV